MQWKGENENEKLYFDCVDKTLLLVHPRNCPLVPVDYFRVSYLTFIQKFIVLQRGYHHARRLNKMNKIKSNDVKKKKISIKDKMDKKK